MKKIFLLILIIAIAAFLRFYKLESIPAGLHADAAAQGYNAFSILSTGQDRYGQPFPILFRTYGYYQPPVYTYLTTLPVTLFGNSQFSVRFLSALSGSMLVLATYLFTQHFFGKQETTAALISALVIAVAPWSVFFSRLAIEANLALFLSATSLLLFAYSIKRIQFLPIAGVILGISTHTYYSERLISIILLPIFLLLFRRSFTGKKKWVTLALLLFAVTQLPHLAMIKTGAFIQRFNQVSALDNTLQIQDIISTVLNNYLIYYSPKNLFFDSDINLGRTMPGLSVFYNWLIVPFFVGFWYLLKNRSTQFAKIILLLLILTPLPASLTGDFFYPLRALDFMWILSLVIALGLFYIFQIIKSNITRIPIFIILFIYSLFSLYISYFVLFKYEKAADYGYVYVKLMEKLSEYQNKKIFIDLARDPGIGIRIAYLKSYPPEKMQNQLQKQLKTPYYSSKPNADEVYSIDNIEVKPLSFADACRSNTIMVGDNLSISAQQTAEHGLKVEFEIYDLSGKKSLIGYSTNPGSKCQSV